VDQGFIPAASSGERPLSALFDWTSVGAIANSGTCRSRFRDLHDLSFLGPDLRAQVTTGTQPIGTPSG